MEFVLSDESINTYGFSVLTAGINLDRFKANPVMLNQHSSHTSDVIGRWENIKVVNGKLSATPNFDMKDPAAAVIAGKVDRGFIKGCSVGVSFNQADLKRQSNGSFILVKCELYEASIVAIPSNKSAIRLYAADSGILMSSQDLKLAFGTAELSNNENENTMDWKAWLISLLGLEETATDDEIKAAVEALINEKAEGQEESLTAALEAAIMSGKILIGQEGFYRNAAKHDFAGTMQQLSAMPGKKSLAAMVKNRSTSVQLQTPSGFSPKAPKLETLEDYRLHAPGELQKNPDLFKRLYKATYGVEP